MFQKIKRSTNLLFTGANKRKSVYNWTFNLTFSKRTGENCTRCTTGQNETVFIPQQVNDEPGVAYSIVQSNEKPMMEQHLYAYNKLFKEKTCMVIN
jgi:hypothetical protein